MQLSSVAWDIHIKLQIIALAKLSNKEKFFIGCKMLSVRKRDR